MSYCKIGFLAGVGGNRTGIGDYIKRVSAGKRPPVVMAYDDAGLIAEAQRTAALHGVEPILAFRPSTIYGEENPNYNLPPVEAARQYYDRWAAGIPAEIDRAKVWCIAFNEGRKEIEWGNWWGHVGAEFSRLCLRDGIRVALYGWSAGTPEPEQYITAGYEDLFRLIDANHEKIAFAVHEGVDPNKSDAPAGAIPLINDIPWISGRYRLMFNECDRLGLRRPYVLITECAWRYDSAAPLDVGMGQVIEAARFYLEDPEVLGVALWWLGPGHNGVADTLQPYIVPITSYALSEEFDGVIDPPVTQPGIEIPQGAVDAMARAIRRQPSYIRPIPAEARPALSRAILRERCQAPVVQETSLLYNGVWYTGQSGRVDHTTEDGDRLYMWTAGMAEAQEVKPSV